MALEFILVIGLIFLFSLLAIPIAFSIGLSSIIAIMVDPDITLWLLVQRMFAGLNSFVFLCIPGFLLTANLMTDAGITDHLIKLSTALIGNVRGSLAQINILVSMFFAGISGSSAADTSSVGGVLIPAMEKDGYSKDFTVAVTASSSVMGQIIPPSILMVIYGAMGGVSIAALFLGGAIPGILIGLAEMILVYIYSRRRGYKKTAKANLKVIVLALIQAFPALLIPVIIIGGIISGTFTATEASVVSAVYALFLSLVVYRNISFSRLKQIFVQTAITSSLVLICVAMATVSGYLIAYYGLASSMASFLFSFSQSKIVAMLMVMLLILLVGTFMDGTPAILILLPILTSVADVVGISQVHMGVVVVMSLSAGFITPPYGLCLLMASSIANLSITSAVRAIFPFFVAILLIIILAIVFPGIVMFLPKLIVPKFL